MPSSCLLPDHPISSLQPLSILFSNLMIDFLTQHSLITAPTIGIPIETVGFVSSAVDQFCNQGIRVFSHPGRHN
jgi:hypothetical protein